MCSINILARLLRCTSLSEPQMLAAIKKNIAPLSIIKKEDNKSIFTPIIWRPQMLNVFLFITSWCIRKPAGCQVTGHNTKCNRKFE